MKKKMIGMIAGLSLIASPVLAEGYATVDFIGNNNAIVGESVKVSVLVNDVHDTYNDSGVLSMGGYISFDKDYLECTNYELTTSPYQFYMNENIYKVAGLDFTLANGIKNKTEVITFTFKTLKEGNTEVTLKNAELTDKKSYIDATINGLNISIIEKEEVSEPTENIIEETKRVETTTVAKVETTKKVDTSKETQTKEEQIVQKTTTKIIKKEQKKAEKHENIITIIVKFFKKLFK